MDRIEASLEFSCGVWLVGGSTAETLTTVWHEAPNVIHVDKWETRGGNASRLGYCHGLFQSVVHPYLAYGDHQRKANRPAILLCVMPRVKDEVRGREAKRDEVTDFVGGKICTEMKGRVGFQELSNAVDRLRDRDRGEEGGGIV